MRVLGLFPHPDDESWAAGATLAQCAGAGADVRVVSATRGEAGRDRRGAAHTPAQLAALRTGELEAACRTLGARLDGFLDLPDGRLAEVDCAAVDAAIDATLTRIAPQFVLTFGPDGAYGSLDHIAFAARVAAAGRRFPAVSVLHAAFPAGHFAPLRRRLARAGLGIDTAVTLGVPAASVALTVQVGQQRSRKLAAIAAHRSQLRNDDPLSFLGGGILAPLLDAECFTVSGCASST